LQDAFKFTIPKHLHKFISPRGYNYHLASDDELEEIYKIFFPRTVMNNPNIHLWREDSIKRFEDFVLPCILACSIWHPHKDLLVYFKDI
ncbi:hypothetical protein DFH28DRAFT_824859, partial [Melampsora americana]